MNKIIQLRALLALLLELDHGLAAVPGLLLEFLIVFLKFMELLMGLLSI